MIDSQKILDALRDDEQYYGEFGQQYLSNSDVGTLLKNPTQFRKPQAVSYTHLTLPTTPYV